MTREELEKRLESVKKQMIGLQDEIQNLEANRFVNGNAMTKL